MHVEKERRQMKLKGGRLERPEPNKPSITNAPHVHLNIFFSYHQLVMTGRCDRSGLWAECLWMLVESYCHTIPPDATAENTVQIDMADEHTNAQNIQVYNTETDAYCSFSGLLYFVCEQGTQDVVVVYIVKSVVKYVHSHFPLLW